MKLLIEQRGKTTKIMEEFINDPKSILIVIHHAEKARIIDFFKPAMTDQDIRRIVTLQEYQNNKTRGLGYERILIDNADILLQSMFREPIELITINKNQ